MKILALGLSIIIILFSVFAIIMNHLILDDKNKKMKNDKSSRNIKKTDTKQK